jgi:membrane protein implicated in regulation of membrane protease activity
VPTCALLLVLLAAGIVLAFSWLVSFPEIVLAAAWLVAFAAMAVVIGSAFREARESVSSPPVGKSFKALGRFVFWFF